MKIQFTVVVILINNRKLDGSERNVNKCLLIGFLKNKVKKMYTCPQIFFSRFQECFNYINIRGFINLAHCIV